MAFIIYGTSKTIIGIDEVMKNCAACEVDTFQEILVTSNYYHMFYVPIFPIEKEVTFVCGKCGMRQRDVPMTKQTIKDFDEINRKFRHPWFTWFFCLAMASLVLISAIISVV